MSFSTPYIFNLSLFGKSPIKFPIPQPGSNIFPFSSPILDIALYISLTTTGGV